MRALLNPAILGLGGGVAVSLVARRSVAPRLATLLSIATLGLLGAKSGLVVAEDGASLVGVVVVCTVISMSSAIVARFAFGRVARLGPADAGALAVHYASVSVATYPLLTAYLERTGFVITGHIASTFVVLEVLGILAGLTVASLTGAATANWGHALRRTLVGREIVALTATFIIAAVLGERVSEDASFVIRRAFTWIVPIYMVTVGMTLGSRMGDIRRVTRRLVVTTIGVSMVTSGVALVAARLASWPAAETAALLVMTASASYVAAPAIVRRAIPDASPAVYLTCAIAITFPLNVTVGIPGFVALAKWLG